MLKLSQLRLESEIEGNYTDAPYPNTKGLVHLFMLQGSKGAKEHFWSTILEQKMYEVQRSKGAKED